MGDIVRLTSDIFVSALVRRVFSDGHFGTVERRGATEAGVILVKARHRDGTANLYAPAPQTAFDSDKPADRMFELRLECAAEDEIAAFIAREARFDSDIWVVEIEVERPGDYLQVVAPE